MPPGLSSIFNRMRAIAKTLPVFARSVPVHQSLSDYTTKGGFGASRIVHPKRNTVLLAEIELGKITVQMALAGVLIGALHAAFKDAEEALDRVGVDRPVLKVNVFLLTVAHYAMLRKALIQIVIMASFVRHDAGFLGDVFFQDRDDGPGLQIVHNSRAHRFRPVSRSSKLRTFILW